MPVLQSKYCLTNATFNKNLLINHIMLASQSCNFKITDIRVQTETESHSLEAGQHFTVNAKYSNYALTCLSESKQWYDSKMPSSGCYPCSESCIFPMI